VSDNISWDAVRQRYIESDLSVEKVALEFGAPAKEVQRRATADEWVRQRKAYRKAGYNDIALCDNTDIENTRKILSAELDVVRKQEWASWDKRHLKLAKTVSEQITAVARLPQDPKSLLQLAQAAKILVDLERAVHGRADYDRMAAQFVNQVVNVNAPKSDDLPDDDADLRRQARALLPRAPLDTEFTVIEDAADG
jgi:hypothetical protein